MLFVTNIPTSSHVDFRSLMPAGSKFASQLLLFFQCFTYYCNSTNVVTVIDYLTFAMKHIVLSPAKVLHAGDLKIMLKLCELLPLWWWGNVSYSFSGFSNLEQLTNQVFYFVPNPCNQTYITLYPLFTFNLPHFYNAV